MSVQLTAFPIYAVVGIPVIFTLLGFLGVLVPPTIAFFFPAMERPRSNGLAEGLILAVGYTPPHSPYPWSFPPPTTQSCVPLHCRPFDSFRAVLTDEQSQVESYSWAAWVSMMGVIICFSIEKLVERLGTFFGVSSLHAHGRSAHAAPHVGHSLEEPHEQNDGECDAQPLDEMCHHHHHHSLRVSTSGKLELDEGRMSKPT